MSGRFCSECSYALNFVQYGVGVAPAGFGALAVLDGVRGAAVKAAEALGAPELRPARRALDHGDGVGGAEVRALATVYAGG